ncbi:MAG: endonuclease domain-containing protein [Anaerolineales bacterium]|nr:endonuclease domain-containing protein [Anaerolineales bacterium]
MEKILWKELRASKLGVYFRRQQVIQGFIVDFYCHPVKIARGLRQVRVGCGSGWRCPRFTERGR